MDDMMTCFNYFEELIKNNNKIVEAIGDCPNLEVQSPVFISYAESGKKIIIWLQTIANISLCGVRPEWQNQAK